MTEPTHHPQSVTASGDDMLMWCQYARLKNATISRLEVHPKKNSTYTLHFIWPSITTPDQPPFSHKSTTITPP